MTALRTLSPDPLGPAPDASSLQAASVAQDETPPLERLMAQLQGQSEFPALSHAIREVSCLTRSDRENLSRLSTAVMQDFALSQRLLRLANSSAYRPAGQEAVTTVSRALMVLGMDTVRTISVSLLLFENLKSVPKAQPLRDEFVRATVASSIARAVLGSGTRVCEEAGLAAMFHRLGQVMVLQHFPGQAETLQAMATDGGSRQQAERDARRVLGVSYEELGAAVGQSWGFPDILLQGLYRLDPQAAAPKCLTYESTVRVAACFAAEFCDLIAAGATAASNPFEPLSRRFAASLELKDGALADLMKLSLQRTEQLGQAMGIDLSTTPFGRQMLGFDRRDTGQSSGTNAARESTPQDVGHRRAIPIESGKVLKPAAANTTTGSVPRPAARALQEHELVSRRQALANGLAALSEQLTGRFVLNDLVRGALDTLHSALGCRSVLFAVRDAQGDALKGRLASGDLPAARLRLFRILLDEDSDLLGAAARKGADLLISDASAKNVAARLPAWYRQHFAAGSFLLLPVMLNGAPTGMIYADTEEAGGLQIEESALTLVRGIRNQVVMALRQSATP